MCELISEYNIQHCDPTLALPEISFTNRALSLCPIWEAFWTLIELFGMVNSFLCMAAIQSVMKDKPSEKGIKTFLFCFICLGQQDWDIGKRTYKFSSHGNVTKHIKRKHFRGISPQSKIRCNVCDELFSCEMHL